METLLGPMELWLVGGLAAYSAAITLLTSWFVAGLWGRKRRATSASNLLAQLVWALLIFAAGWLTIRYAERLAHPALGYAAGIILTIVLSIARAVLSQAIGAGSRPEERLTRREPARRALDEFTYVLAALTACLLVSLLLRARVDPLLLIPLAIGAVLPGLVPRERPAGSADQQSVTLRGNNPLRAIEWHSLGGAAVVAIVTLPLLVFGSATAWAMIPAGYLCHLVVDLARPKGVMLLWPASRKRYEILDGIIGPADGPTERRFLVVLVIVLIVALLVADVGPPHPPPVYQPSYEQTLERYYSLRGRRLVYADLNGSWQASGRRLSGRFEVLNALGRSYVLLETYSGRVFTGGREATEHLYLDNISLVPGAEARVKPVEFSFAGERLAAVLPIVYAMQSEPGLQHIYVSGEIILASHEPEGLLERFAADYSQTRVRRFEGLADRHYRLSYVPASQLVALAGITVDEGELLVVATYQRSPAGPTVTPLPSPSVLFP